MIRNLFFLFISHFHLDHIAGLHILTKFRFKQGLKIIGKIGAKKAINIIVNDPFTVKIEDLPFEVEIEEFDEGSYHSPLNFNCKLLPHPDPSMGYRFEVEDKIITYCTDCGPHENIISLARNSDVLISECAKLPNETSDLWPHLNPTEAAEIAVKSKIKRLILTHFSAARYRTLRQRKKAEKVDKTIFRNTIAAYDNFEISI